MSSLFNAVFFTTLLIFGAIILDVFEFITIRDEKEVIVLTLTLLAAFVVFYFLPSKEGSKGEKA